MTDAIETERVAEGLDVGRAVGDASTGIPRRTAVPRTVVREQVDALRLRVRQMWLVHEAGAGRPVHDQHRHAAWHTALADGQRSTGGTVDRAQGVATLQRQTLEGGVGANPLFQQLLDLLALSDAQRADRVTLVVAVERVQVVLLQ